MKIMAVAITLADYIYPLVDRWIDKYKVMEFL